MSGARFDVEAMIAAGRADAPGEAVRARLLAGLRPRLAVPAWRTPAGLAAGAAVLVAAALLFRLLGPAVDAHREAAPAEPVRVEAVSPAPAPLAETVRIEAASPAPAPLAQTVRVQPPRPAAAAKPAVANEPAVEEKPAPVSSLAEEARLLREAQRALDRADAPSARAALQEHAARFAAGILAPERHAALALAACLDGQTAEARREVDHLMALAPQSPLLARLKSSCAFSHESDRARPLNGPP